MELNFFSTFPLMDPASILRGFRQRSTTAKAAMVGYRTGSTHPGSRAGAGSHADHAAALAVDTHRTW